MKKTKFLFSLLITLFMVAMSPLKAWAIPVNDVAKVTINGQTSGYDNFTDALTAAKAGTTESPATLTLLADYETTASLETSSNNVIDLTSGTMTIDLNGHEIKYNNSNSSLQSLFYIDGAEVTFDDSSTGHTGKVSGNTAFAIYYSSGKLQVNGGTFEGTTHGLHFGSSPSSAGIVALHGGTFLTKVTDNNRSPIYCSTWDYLGMDDYYFSDENGKAILTNNYIPTLPGHSSVTVKSAILPSAEGAVASVTTGNTTYYCATLEKAFSLASAGTAASPVTVTLLADLDYSSVIKQYVFELTQGVMTLDLNGHTIIGSRGDSSYNSCAIILIKGADVTINDNSTSKAGKVCIPSTTNNTTIYAIDFDAKTNGSYNGGKLQINGGTFEGHYGLWLNSPISSSQSDVTLHGGTFKGKAYSVYTYYSSLWDHLGMEDYYFTDASGNEVLVNPYSPVLENNKQATVTSALTTVTDANAVASLTIGSETKYYLSLTKALTAASAGTTSTPATLKLLKDYSGAVNGEYFIKLPSGVITLDLNGKSIVSTSHNKSVISVTGANLTVEDNSSSKSGKIESSTCSRGIAEESGSLHIKGGTYKAAQYSAYLNSNSQISGGTFITASAGSIFITSGNCNTILSQGYQLVDENDVAVDGANTFITTTVYVIPTSSDDYLCFTAEEAGAVVYMTYNTSESIAPTAALQTSTDKSTWSDVVFTQQQEGSYKSNVITLDNEGDKVYFRAKTAGSLSSKYSIYKFSFVNTESNDEELKVAASGNIMSLLDPTCMSKTVSDYGFSRLFEECKSLTSAPELPAKTIGKGAYKTMFCSCESLTEAPNLPAKNVSEEAYSYMFGKCTNLMKAPVISAEKVEYQGCYYMFTECQMLSEAPALNAEELGDDCYMQMFSYCTNLTTVPTLPATNLPDFCYASMFSGCSSLKVEESSTGTWSIPADATGDNWSSFMFGNTAGSVVIPEKGKTYSITAVEHPTVTLNTAGYATYSSLINVSIKTAGVKAYYVTQNGNDLTPVELDGAIPAQTGVILYGTPGTVVEFVNATEKRATIIEDNELQSTTPIPTVTLSPTDAIWALGDANAFQQYTGEFILNRAYIIAPKTSADGSSPAKALRFVGVETAVQGINSGLQGTKNGKYIVNGKLVIVKNGKKYNAQGVMVK